MRGARRRAEAAAAAPAAVLLLLLFHLALLFADAAVETVSSNNKPSSLQLSPFSRRRHCYRQRSPAFSSSSSNRCHGRTEQSPGAAVPRRKRIQQASSHCYDAPLSSSSPLPPDTVVRPNSIQLSRSDAAQIMDQVILPRDEYGHRLNAGRDAQGLLLAEDDDSNGGGVPPLVVSAQDPRLAYTYGEFPLSSLDELLDVAVSYIKPKGTIRFVDMGSGCGRLCLYAALSRPDWDVTGIECAQLLHQQAVHATQRAVDAGYVRHHEPNESTGIAEDRSSSSVRFLCANAHDPEETAVRRLLEQADVVFAYSTTWDTSGFSTVTSSMILSNEWHHLFTSCCKPGCVVITTDRSLDAGASSSSWTMLAQIAVDNPEVGGSIGYVHQRMM